GPEYRACGTRACDAAADSRVEALHTRGFGKVILHRTLYAGERIVETGEPAIVLGYEFVEEGGALIGGCAGKLGPTGGGALSTGNEGLAVADFKHSAEEVEHVGVGLEARDGGRFAQGFRGVAVEF